MGACGDGDEGAVESGNEGAVEIGAREVCIYNACIRCVYIGSQEIDTRDLLFIYQGTTAFAILPAALYVAGIAFDSMYSRVCILRHISFR